MKYQARLAAMVVGILLPWAVQAQTAAKKVVVVAVDGSGQYKTVQEAVDASPGGNVRIDIKTGEYWGLVKVTANNVELHGLGKVPQDVVLLYDNSAGTPGPDGRQLGTGKSGTVTVTGNDFTAENLTMANDFEWLHGRTNEGSQAVALRVSGDREIFRNVRLLGYQDTLYADSTVCHAAGETGPCTAGRQYFADCYIEGHVDFIFGDAKAVFDRCTINALPHSTVTLTAQSRFRPSEDSGYVFRDCTVTADPGTTSIFLGRPWRPYSTVLFINTDFKAQLESAGWKEWSGALATSDYEEYNSHGMAGDVSKRISPSKQMTAADVAKYDTKTWLAGTDGWDPEKVQ